MAETHVTTIRLDAALAEDVAACARIEGQTVSEFIRQALADRVIALHRDTDFRARVARRIKDDAEILRRLGSDPEQITRPGAQP